MGAGVRVAQHGRGCSARVRYAKSVAPDGSLAARCRRWHAHDRANRTFGILAALCLRRLGGTRHGTQTLATSPTVPKARRRRGGSADRRFDRVVRPPRGSAAGGVRRRWDYVQRGSANAAGIPAGNGSRRRLCADQRSPCVVSDVSAVRARHDAVQSAASLASSRSRERPRLTGTPPFCVAIPTASGSPLRGVLATGLLCRRYLLTAAR